jgi:hypothetical protein
MARSKLLLLVFLLGACTSWAAEEYNGPRPPKPDVVYLLHADNLIPTDAVDAQQENKKDDVIYSVAGTSATAKTPLAEPIFLLQSDKIAADSIELYGFEVKGGRREVSISQKRGKGARPYRLSVTELDRGLYRLEASETLENGEYGLSPSGSNKVLCFSVF